MKILTDLQKQLWKFILSYYEEHGVFPGYAEMQEEFNYSSSNSIFQHLNNLVKKNYLSKSGRGNYDIHPTKRSQLASMFPGIPIKGRIAAGGMHEAINEDLGYLPVEIHPDKMTKYFSLLVDGDSMIEANIRDGDYIILAPREPQDGEIGAISYNGETSLKTIIKKRSGVELKPENPAYRSIHIEPDEWEEITVFGTYIGKAWKNNGSWGLIFQP